MKIREKRYAFIGCDNQYKESKIVLFGAPFDSTSSFRPGSRFAPSSIRTDSIGMELYSPYLDKSLEDINVFDGGDLILPFGDARKAVDRIEKYVTQVVKDNKTPVMLGGEHLVTLGAVRGVFKKYSDLHVIHFDAHTDLRDEFFDEKLSHATVIRRVWDIVGDNKIFQFGIRSGEKEEFEWAKKHSTLSKFNFDGLEEAIEKVKGKPVYFTLDLDILDPAYFWGTGTPEPGGVTFLELLAAMGKVAQGCQIVGCDINELSPPYDASGASTAVACKLLRELLLQL